MLEYKGATFMCGGAVGVALDLQLTGVTGWSPDWVPPFSWASYLYLCASVTKQYLVPAKGQ